MNNAHPYSHLPQAVLQPVKEQLQDKRILILGLSREGWSNYQFIRRLLPQQELTLADQKTQKELVQKKLVQSKQSEQDRRSTQNKQQNKKLITKNEVKTKWRQTLAHDPQLKWQLGKKYLKQLERYDLIVKTAGIPATLEPIQAAVASGTKLTSNLELFLTIIQSWQKVKQQRQKGQDTNSLAPSLEVASPSSPTRSPALNNTQEPLTTPLTIGITGTKGKSTTSALIHHVLSANNLEAALIGNIGMPPLSQLDQITSNSKLVIEMSSHQLACLKTSPDIAVIQEITSEHLDYYASTEAYIQAKQAITKYQKVNQYVITDPSWQHSWRMAQDSAAQPLLFLSQGKDVYQKNKVKFADSDIQVYLKSNKLIVRYSLKERKKRGNAEQQNKAVDSSQFTTQSATQSAAQSAAQPTAQSTTVADQELMPTNTIPLLGKHNLANVMPAVVIGKLFNLAPQQIRQAIETFQPLPHRLQFVAEKNGVKYYNDSLATTPEAAISALSVFSDQSIILLAGGHERRQNFGSLAQKILQQSVKALILFPPTGQRLWQQVKTQQKATEKEMLKQKTPNQQSKPVPLPQHWLVESMSAAFEHIQALAQPGDIVLLSPAAASFGVFRDYKDRGEQFCQQVKLSKFNSADTD
jgi:UDP-N-acetylmuramoylalanine--D-glutamate ligase